MHPQPRARAASRPRPVSSVSASSPRDAFRLLGLCRRELFGGDALPFAKLQRFAFFAAEENGGRHPAVVAKPALHPRTRPQVAVTFGPFDLLAHTLDLPLRCTFRGKVTQVDAPARATLRDPLSALPAARVPLHFVTTALASS